MLVTGGAGFIGSNFVIYLLEKHEDLRIINLDKLTYAGDFANLNEISSHPNHIFVEGDICDRALLDQLFKQYDFDGVLHLAAESHVDNSIDSPGEFISTNIVGSFNLLEASRKYWMDGPHQPKMGKENNRFLHVSTDEVYGSLGPEGLFTEETPYAPNSPYSASKASSDFLVRSYFHTYGLNVVITNCSNNFGPKQHDEKLIPTIIRNAIKANPIPIYGDGQNVRDWLYVEDHCRALETVFLNGKHGETYNIGGSNERNNLFIAKYICKLLDEAKPRSNGVSYEDLIEFVKDRPGHDWRYAIDSSKMSNTLNWNPEESFESGMKKTVEWYLNKYKS